MKKTLALAFALVLAFGLAAPALAFFGDVPNDAPGNGAKVDIYLVDYDGQGGLLSGLLEKPAADRGYAKNEIVAAVASLTVPKGVQIGVPNSLIDPGYQAFILGGDNVNVNVAENNIDAMNNAALANTFPGSPAAIFSAADNTLSIPVAGMTETGTFRALYFAKVTGGDAAMRATLSKNLRWSTVFSDYPFLLLGDTGYHVIKLGQNPNYEYHIYPNDPSLPPYVFIIHTNASGREEGVEVNPSWGRSNWFGVSYNGGYTYTMTWTLDDNLGRIPTDEEKLILDDLMNRIFTDTLGLDITKRGYLMDDDVWEAYANSMSDLIASVDVKPWTPYVAAPR